MTTKIEDILVSVNYDEYRPGMKIYFLENYQGYKEGDTAIIKSMSGFDGSTYTHPRSGGCFFITDNNKKVEWGNRIRICCLIEQDPTTVFLQSMYSKYEQKAERMKEEAKAEDPDWFNKDRFDEYIAEKYDTLDEILLAYKYKRLGFNYK
ncbi:hypothetical protein MKY20_24845 [Cytobacillus sp. FSL W8-0315]|uniref:hypothetical protein n=1 Tax=Cytobacillus sp. FSL W8-0315 TaxID=2921600 RepID=UPI0001F45A6E|nr:hypothetical protein HMPREF1013_05220 [Bacillus sp. 2_A_57_CT2]